MPPRKRHKKHGKPKVPPDAGHSATVPPIAAIDKTARYANLPKPAKDLVVSLRKLQLRIESGVTYDELKQALGDLYPDLVVFSESEDGRRFPELGFLFENAGRFYVMFRALWNQELFHDDPVQRYAAASARRQFQHILLTCAAVNISAARVLAEGKPNGVAKVLQDIEAKPESFSNNRVLEGLEKVVSGEIVRESQTSSDAQAELERRVESVKKSSVRPMTAAEVNVLKDLIYVWSGIDRPPGPPGGRGGRVGGPPKPPSVETLARLKATINAAATDLSDARKGTIDETLKVPERRLQHSGEPTTYKFHSEAGKDRAIATRTAALADLRETYRRALQWAVRDQR